MKSQAKPEFPKYADMTIKIVPSATPEFNVKSDIRGFTLLELLIVSGILAILIAIAIPLWPRYQDLAKSTRAMQEVRMIETSIAAFTADQGRLPDSLADVGHHTLLDPWGNGYVYAKIPFRTYGVDFINGTVGEGYDLYSKGSNGTSTASIVTDESLDDILRAGDGSFVGLSYKFAF